MLSDPIIEELWQIKDAIAREFDYDVDKLFDYLQAQERKRAEAKLAVAGDTRDAVIPPEASGGA